MNEIFFYVVIVIWEIHLMNEYIMNTFNYIICVYGKKKRKRERKSSDVNPELKSGMLAIEIRYLSRHISQVEVIYTTNAS